MDKFKIIETNDVDFEEYKKNNDKREIVYQNDEANI